MKLRAACLCALLVLPLAPCHAAPDWIDTPSTRSFMQRVLNLALLYQESGGLDENGYLIKAAVRPGSVGECKTLDVKITLAGETVREESVRLCPK